MLDELDINPEIIEAIQTKSFGNIRQTAMLNNWPSKILQYCDLRSAPSRLMTLDERIEEIKQRYDKYADRPDYPEMLLAAKSIENQIAQSVDAELEEIITTAIANKYKDKLLTFTIKP